MLPDAFTNQELFLEVGNGHTLYVHDWGNPQAETVIFNLHGGPGSASRDKHKNNFDPAKQRVIFHDQRGCGRSLPYGSLENNNIDALIDDIDTIANKLGIDSFIISGGSWGSCLALAYGIKYPQKVQAMVLYGIFTGSHAEIDWLDKGSFQTFYPDAWQTYLDATPAECRDDPSAYHFKQILGGDEQAVKQSGHAYDTLESSVATLDDRFAASDFTNYDPAGIKLEMFYMSKKCFMPDRYILDNAAKLSMPIWLVQGRYDMVCPPKTAYELHQKLSNSQLIWTIAGHAPSHETWNIMRTTLLQLTA